MVEITKIIPQICMPTAFVPYSELDRRTPTNPLAAVARAAVNAMCQVRAAAAPIFDRPVGGVLGTVQEAMMNRDFWDNICRSTPSPETTSDLPFRGGQCAIPYSVKGSLLRTDITNPQEATITGIPGPIRRIFWTRVFNPGIAQDDYILNVVGADNFQRTQGVGSERPTNRTVYDRYITISPNTPNCGDLIPNTPIPPTPPPSSYTVNNININGQVGPVVVSLPDLVVNNWPDFEFNPRIDLGGITAQFDLGGITINFPDNVSIGDGGSSVDLDPVLNRIDEQSTAIRTDISEVLTEIDDLGTLIGNKIDDLESLIRCCCCEENVSFTINTIVTNTLGGRYEIPDNTIALRIIGSDFDTNRLRTQSGSGDASTVFYWGWYSIAYADGNGGDRVQLCYQEQAVYVFPHAQFVTVNPVYNSRATIVAIVKNKNCNP